MVKKCLILFGLILSLNNCEKSSEFELIKEPYLGEGLRIDGYYYRMYFNDNTNHEAVEVYFLYRDGVLLYGGDKDFDSFTQIEDLYNQGSHDSAKDFQSFWGIFTIDGVSLNIKKWETKQGNNLPLFEMKCTILNDTSFVRNENSVSDRSGSVFPNDTFNFKQLLPKPDSLNQFVQ